LTVETTTVAATEAVAADLAASLQPGDVVALDGDLGAGKTQFVRGLLRGLGGDPRLVSSPTYTLLNVYPGGRLTLYHVDAYRTAGPDDLAGIGLDELLAQGGVLAVEWPSRAGDLLPGRRHTVRLTAIGDGTRLIEVMSPVAGTGAGL
jgi:tRNA threonylcarbamoyladenosine biosynthesis protein TsaE